MNYVILNGTDSRNIDGLIIQELPPISKPAMRTEVEEIDGRDGDTAINLGYAAYDREMFIGLYGDFDLDSIIGFFNSSGMAIFSNEPDKIYSYRIDAQIDFERLIRFKTATVSFHVQPFKFSTAEKPLTLTPTATNGQGTSITLQPTAEGETLDSIAIYGNTQQTGTPTPSNPVNINNVTGSIPIIFSSGDMSTTVTLSLSRLELCKISTYQDFIYFTNDQWAKHTAIKKFTVNTANITLQNYTNVTYAVIPTPKDALCYGNYKDVPCICTHAAYSYGLPEGWNTVNAINKIFCQADANTFWLGFPSGTSLADIQTALTDCLIYYVLLERTDVPLSSQGLQGQLSSLLEVSLYDGSTTITTNLTVKPIINAAAVMETFTVINTGNIYARPLFTITGDGIVTVAVNGQQIFTITLDGEITIDGAAMEAYQTTPDNLKNRSVTGNYDNFVFPLGKNKIEFSGDVTQLVIDNYSRWI